MNQELVIKIIEMILIPFIFVVAIMPTIKKIAFDLHAIDIPGGRHIHKKPTPKLGGIAIYLGFLLGYMLFGKHGQNMEAILIGSFIILLTGIADDLLRLKPLVKFIGQLLAALVVVFFGQILISDVSAFGFYIDFSVWSYPLTIFFILGCINCINLIDGLDGLSGGISSIYYLTIGIIAIMQGKFGNDFVLTFVMLGSTLGFLVYNFNPASIFAGDTGSMFMGYIIAIIALLGFKNVTMTSLIIPLIILAIPILDTVFAIIRRLLKGQSISKADKFHVHHQFLNRNFSTKQTVLIIYAIDILFAVASIVYIYKDNFLGYIVYGILLFLVIGFVFKTNIIFDRELIKQKFKKSN